MSSSLIDKILSLDGLMIGVSYVLAWSVVLVIAVHIMDRMERRRLDKIAARVIRDARRSGEDAAREVA